MRGIGMLCGDLEHSESCRDFWYCRGIKFEEVIRKMRRGRAVRPHEISVELWKTQVKHVWNG